MNIYNSLLLYFLLIFDLFLFNYAYIQLYNTEDALDIQSYDCIYYTNVTARNNETIPYCIRTNKSILLNRSFSSNICGNDGKAWNFRSLKEMNVSQDEILTWNSSIEMADRYAAYLTTGREELADEKICNCSSNTFGKFCEYQFMTFNTFEQIIQYQFHLKAKYQNGSQLWGNITCYTTLTDCYYGLRCLTWQNICDGKQQCMDGIDEDHCEELEFNECEEKEYRCEDGSCISEEYWLDGTYDCSDKSDEQQIAEYLIRDSFCPLTSSQFICDETIAYHEYFACGDGQFQFDFVNNAWECYNFRNMMFFCELPMSYRYGRYETWTLDNGHCADRGSIQKSLFDMDELEACVFYLRCKLTNATVPECNDVIHRFHSLCQNRTITYPLGPIFRPYFQTVYELSNLQLTMKPSYIIFNGSIKCLGYQACFSSSEVHLAFDIITELYHVDALFCNYSETSNVCGPQINKTCWYDTTQSHLCEKNSHCISKHRLRDSVSDCIDGTDESGNQSYYIKKRHRLNCSKEISTFLLLKNVGDNKVDCYGASDEYITQLQWNLFDHQCRIPNSMECNILKDYIQSPSSLLTINNNKILLFRQYCDTLWHLSKGFDESLCKKWKCPKDQYQCMTGHCIPIDAVYGRIYGEWNCPDASDTIGLLAITQLSQHNLKLISDFQLQNIKINLIDHNDDNQYVPFTAYCNESEEYGCVLANVNDPLNFTINRPCINLTQIGNGIIDCHGGLDERNLLTCGNNLNEQRGFDFHCSDQECIPYHLHCIQRCSNNADSLLCDQFLTLWDPVCRNLQREYFCVFQFIIPKCNLYDFKKFYCDSARLGFNRPTTPYRLRARRLQKVWLYLPEYPTTKISIPYLNNQSSKSETTNNYSDIPDKQENYGQEGWICGRGVAIKTNKDNQIQCLCPPSLYGQYCQYFSDRITIITSLTDIPSEFLEQQSQQTIKILVLLLSNDAIIDYHIFHLPLTFSKELNKKFRFNLIYQRPKLSSNLYKIRFEAYDSSVKFLGVWEYIIKFPFLPSYRFVQILKFTRTHICQTSNPCLHNSTCHTIMNKINDISTYYCQCKNRTFGKYCQHIQQSIISSNCSKYALLYSVSSTKSICLCPIHLYGPTCHLNRTCINKNPCGGNERGKCYFNPDNITRDYICICDKKFFGDHCEFNSSMVQINFTNFSFVQIPSNFILSTIIQLCDLHNETLDLIIHEKRVYQGLPPSIIQIYHNNYHLPIIGIMKFYHKHNLSNDFIANLKQPDYFILYITSSNVSQMEFTLEINITNYCPHTSNIFEKNISHASYLSQFLISNTIDSNMTTIVFEYHRLCDKPYSLICFHDNNYFCVCDYNSHAECSRYNSTLDQCSGRCLVNGQCIQGDLDNQRDFVCLCPRCYYGSVCQHNTELFSFTLETLLANDLSSSSLVIQELFFYLLIIIPVILLVIGGVNNILCFLTFNRPKPLLVGIGHYLRIVSIINQLTLLILLLKLLHLILSIKGYIIHHLINLILCKVLSYLLACTSRMSYWLMSIVAIERVYVTWYITGTWLKSPRIAKRIIASVIIGILACDVHELIYYQSTEDPKSLDMNNSTLCVTSYPFRVATYNQVNIILNYILPFLINLLSTITLIILIIKQRAASVAKKHDNLHSSSSTKPTFRTYVDLLMKKKELILAPLVTMLPQLFSLPQFILSFSLACQDFKVNWQRYLLIVSYFIMYLPQVLSYVLYISPSTFYTNEFHETKLYKTIDEQRKKLLSKKKTEILVNRKTNQTPHVND